MATEIQYPDHFIERLHAVWGEGFLSPGGKEDVHEIMRGFDWADKLVLDIGFGTADPAMVLAHDLGARRVIGIDVEEPLHRRATEMVGAMGLTDRIDLRLVELKRASRHGLWTTFNWDEQVFDNTLILKKHCLVCIHIWRCSWTRAEMELTTYSPDDAWITVAKLGLQAAHVVAVWI